MVVLLANLLDNAIEACRKLNDCFGENGLGYQMVRTHFGSCDFSLCNYSAAETKEDITEGTLSFAHDEKYIVPYIRMASEIRGGSLRLC